MKRLCILIALGTVILLALRRVASEAGPAMRAKCSEMCEQMLGNMPESFPPNRMMADLDTLKEQTARILDLVQRQTGDQA